MQLLELFWSFLKIGLFTIGGGYAMIPLIQDEVMSKSWLTGEQMVNFLAISESTPGPFAVNIATFIGSSQAGILGAVVATLGVVTPSFIIILIIASIAKKILKNKYVKYGMQGAKAIAIGLIIIAAGSIIYNNLFIKVESINVFDYRAIIIMLVSIMMLRFKKTSNPIFIILVSAGLGLILYSI